MLCEICLVREASIKLTQVINSKKKDIAICKECAEEKGLFNPMIGLQKFFGSLLLLNQLKDEENAEQKEQDTGLYCENCQTTWREFQNGGLLGCSDCYRAFGEKLRIVLRRIHGSTKHIGNRPANHRIILNDSDIAALKKKLERAVRTENYERAAELRDRIKDIEAVLTKK